MIRRALVALDSSARASGVFRRAAEIARGCGPELILFRVVAVPQEFPAAGAGTPADALAPELIRAAHEDLKSYAAAAPDVQSSIVVDVDLSPHHAIIAAAENFEVDLIVIGNHGYHGMDRILGTTAGHVLHGAKRDVLIVYRGDARSP